MESGFNGAELRLARVFNGFALEEVAEQVEKTRQYLHKLETGQAVPTDQLLDQLAIALNIKPEFLTAPALPLISEEQFHFRKLFTTRAMVKHVAMARGEMNGRLISHLDSELKLPDINIPEVSDIRSLEDVENAADFCRREWGLGMGPINNMTRLAEHIGAVVTTFKSVSKEIDALSVAIRRPIIVRNEAKESVCRHRFDIAHELGHFVVHPGIPTGDRLTEGQANRFASALLIPRSMMAKLFPRPRGSRLDWIGIREFKLTWKVSKAAILYRARQLDLISDDQYKTGVITLRRTGEAGGEREDHLIAHEPPELLSRSLSVLAEKKGISSAMLAEKLLVTPNFLQELVGFDLGAFHTQSPSDQLKRSHLRVV
jgi:Zn-dependent peptidase ImmA (M78 family)